MTYRSYGWDDQAQLPWRSAAGHQHLSARAAPTPTPTPAPSNTPLLHVSGSGALVFIGVVAFAVAILWLVPTVYDLHKTDKWRSTQQNSLLEKMVDGLIQKGLSVEDVRQIASAVSAPPRGMQGLTQALLGLIITTLVGVAMVATLVSTAADSSDLRKTIITALLSILGTIAGFYFGARTAQISSEQVRRPPVPSTGPPTEPESAPPSVSDINPKAGPMGGGKHVTVTGSGFTGATAVNFGTTAASNLTVASDSQLTVTSPPTKVTGTVDVTVTTPTGTSTATPADQYAYADPAVKPEVTDVSPKTGPATGGQVVTVTGRGLAGVTTVRFGEIPASNLTVASDTQLTVTSPPGEASPVPVPVHVSVATLTERSDAVADDQYTYTTG
jgi:hypothetical protein